MLQIRIQHLSGCACKESRCQDHQVAFYIERKLDALGDRRKMKKRYRHNSAADADGCSHDPELRLG